MPLATPPPGRRYWLGTWSGRLILVNAVIFIVLSWQAGSLFVPDTTALLDLGAKDPVALAQGQYWRLFTPIFLHIGLIHFAVNSYMLYVIGWQLERIIGGAWYLLIYLVAGIAGNVASAVFSVGLSAGASGALFGLLGTGFYLERTIGRRIEEATGRRPKSGAYAMTVVINLIFGVVVPFIDNAAHVGGLLAGVLLTFAMVNVRPNSLQRPRKVLGLASVLVLVSALGAGVYWGCSSAYQAGRLEKAGDQARRAPEQVYYYSQVLAIFPERSAVRLKRARLFFLEGEAKYAFQDLRRVVRDEELRPEVNRLADELAARGLMTEAWQVRRFLEYGAPEEL